jgi:hypothetical protein
MGEKYQILKEKEWTQPKFYPKPLTLALRRLFLVSPLSEYIG